MSNKTTSYVWPEGHPPPCLVCGGKCNAFAGKAYPPIIKASDVVEISGLDRKTVYDCISDGTIPGAKKVGKRGSKHPAIIICRDQVFHWLAGQGPSPHSRG